jgi:protoporphyrinogen oxidase
MIREYDYIILGAGPSGLSFANRLLQHGVRHSDILVIEKEASVGGLCRSTAVDGSPLDIGGGHFLDVKNTEVVEFLFGFLPSDEWMRYSRISHINYQNMAIDYPFESNLWQLPIDTQVRFLESIANAGCLIGHPMPLVFPDWIRWKLGNQIAEEYMLPYNEKIWSCDLNTLGTYWKDASA